MHHSTQNSTSTVEQFVNQAKEKDMQYATTVNALIGNTPLVDLTLASWASTRPPTPAAP